MPESIQPSDAARYLTAFADGELDSAQRAVVLEHLARSPQSVERLAAEARFRQAVGRNLQHATPSVSAELKRRVESLSQETSAADSAPSRVSRHGRWWRAPLWPVGIAAAACLIAGIWVGRLSSGPGIHTREEVVDPVLNPISPTVIASVVHIHVDCSRAPDHHTAVFPKALGNLEGSLKAYLGRPVPYPDLSAIGYEYVGAGPCGKVLENTAHLLYRAKGGSVTDTVSLFVQTAAETTAIQEGKVYWAQGKDAAHPMIVWRRENLVFFLVGDADEPVSRAAEIMGVKASL